MEKNGIFNGASSFNKLIIVNQDLMDFLQEVICLKQIKDGAYVINLDEYADVGMHWVALFCKRMFLTKLNNLLGIKTSKQTYLEHN